jgi:hypothetical protein
MSYHYRKAARAAALCGLFSNLGWAAPVTGAQPEVWRAATGITFTSGDYGTDSKTNSTYLPFEFDRLFAQGRLGLILPFVSVTTEQDVTFVGGRPRQSGRERTRATIEKHTESGLGDIVLRGIWDAYEGSDRLPSLSLYAKVKCPTADEDKGLGTGHFDESVGLETSKDVGHQWFVNGTFGYTFVGSSDDNPLRDSWNIGAGGGRYLPYHLTGSAEITWSRAIVSGDPDPADLTFGLQYTGIPRAGLGTSLGFGLSNGSPDVSFGLSGAYRF